MAGKLFSHEGNCHFTDSSADDPEWWLKCTRIREAAFKAKTSNRADMEALKASVKFIFEEVIEGNSAPDHDGYLADFVRRTGLDALAEIGKRGDKVLINLATEMSRDDSWRIRCGAIRLLSAVGENKDFVVELLVHAYRTDTDSMVRKTCVKCLPGLCKKVDNSNRSAWKRILDELFMALGDDEYEIQSEARKSLNTCLCQSNLAPEGIILISSYMTHQHQVIRDVAQEIFMSTDCVGKSRILMRALLKQLKDTIRDLPSKAIAADILLHLIKCEKKISEGSEFQQDMSSLEFNVHIQCSRSRHPSPEVRSNALETLAILDLQCSDHAQVVNGSSVSDQIQCALIDCLNDPVSRVVKAAIRVVSVKRNYFRDNSRVTQCLSELIQRELDSFDARESPPREGDAYEIIAREAIVCLGAIVSKSYFEVLPVLSACSENKNPRIRSAAAEAQSLLDSDDGCLVARLRAGVWEDRLLCIQQLRRAWSSRGPSFVDRCCWHDATARPGDCVFAVLRRCLGLYTGIREMRRQVPAVGEDGPELCDESIWQQLEVAFSCSIRVVDAYTMNTIRQSTQKTLRANETVEILVLNGHAYCHISSCRSDTLGRQQQRSDSPGQHGTNDSFPRCNAAQQMTDDSAFDVEEEQHLKVTVGTEGCEFETISPPRQSGKPPDTVVSALLECLECDNINLKLCSVGALGDIASKGDSLAIAGLIRFANSVSGDYSGHSLTCSKAIVRALAQISEPGNCDCLKILHSYLSHESIDIQGMSVWAIGQIAHANLGIFTPDLHARLRQSLLEMAYNSEALSQISLMKIIKWALQRIPVIDVTDSECFVQNSLPDSPKNAKEESPTHNPEFQGQICADAKAEEEKMPKWRTPETRVPINGINDTKSVLKLISKLGKSHKTDLTLDTDSESFEFLLCCLHHIKPEVREASFQIFAATFHPGNPNSFNILTRTLLKKCNEEISCALLLLLEKLATPDDDSVSSFVTKYLFNKVKMVTSLENYSSNRKDLGKQSKTIACALQVLTNLEASGSRRLMNAAISCCHLSSEVICEALQEAFSKAITCTGIDDHQLAVIIRYIDSKNSVWEMSEFVQMLKDRLGESRNQKVILCLKALSQRSKQPKPLHSVRTSQLESEQISTQATITSDLPAKDKDEVHPNTFPSLKLHANNNQTATLGLDVKLHNQESAASSRSFSRTGKIMDRFIAKF